MSKSKRKRKIIMLNDLNGKKTKSFKKKAKKTISKAKKSAKAKMSVASQSAKSKVKRTISQGTNSLKSGDTIKKVAQLVGDSFLSNCAVILTDKLLKSQRQTVQYGAGACASAVVTISALGMGYENVGYGSALVTANQVINTGSSLITGKSLNQHLSK